MQFLNAYDITSLNSSISDPESAMPFVQDLLYSVSNPGLAKVVYCKTPDYMRTLFCVPKSDLANKKISESCRVKRMPKGLIKKTLDPIFPGISKAVSFDSENFLFGKNSKYGMVCQVQPFTGISLDQLASEILKFNVPNILISLVFAPQDKKDALESLENTVVHARMANDKETIKETKKLRKDLADDKHQVMKVFFGIVITGKDKEELDKNYEILVEGLSKSIKDMDQHLTLSYLQQEGFYHCLPVACTPVNIYAHYVI